MNIFIIGKTKSGKTTLAKELCQIYGFNHIEASGNLKELHPRNKNEFLGNYTERLTCLSNNLLKNDPNYFNKIIKNKLKNKQINVISGIRNPIDFYTLFDFNTDVVIHLTSIDGVEYTDFERLGLDSILSYIKFIKYFINFEIVIKWRILKSVDENIKNNQYLKHKIDEYSNKPN